MKKTLLLIIPLLLFCLSSRAQDGRVSVTLKSGTAIEGNVVEKTSSFLRLETGFGQSRVIYLDDIESITDMGPAIAYGIPSQQPKPSKRSATEPAFNKPKGFFLNGSVGFSRGQYVEENEDWFGTTVNSFHANEITLIGDCGYRFSPYIAVFGAVSMNYSGPRGLSPGIGIGLRSDFSPNSNYSPYINFRPMMVDRYGGHTDISLGIGTNTDSVHRINLALCFTRHFNRATQGSAIGLEIGYSF